MRRPFKEHVCWCAIEILSRLLDRDDRDAVCGDFAESGEMGIAAVRDIFGLVVRRQIVLWKYWKSWLALFGGVVVGCLLLNRVLAWFVTGSFEWLVGFGNFRTPTEDIIYLGSLSLALFTWSWVNGFAVGSLSDRTMWLTGSLLSLFVFSSFCLPLIRWAGAERYVHAPPDILVPTLLANIAPGVVLVLPTLWGLSQGRQRRALKIPTTILIAAVSAILTVLVTWTTGFYENTRAAMSFGSYQAIPWYVRLAPLAALSWPVMYMVLTVNSHRSTDDTPANLHVDQGIR